MDDDERSAAPASERAEERLAQIESLTEIALAHLAVEDLLDELLERVRTILDVDTAAILLLDRNAGALVATAARGLEEEVRQGVTVPLREGFAGRIAADARPVVIDHVDETTVVNPILMDKGIKAMAGVPLLDAGEVVGVLHVGSLVPRDFTPGDVELLELVADRVTGATGSHLLSAERASVLALQRGLLPGRLPTVSGLSMSARYVPGGGSAVGGDWYDVFLLPAGRVGIVIGDVSGHGLQAAIVMGRVRSALRAYALEFIDPADVLTRLDEKLLHFEAGEMATVLYTVLEADHRTARMACAGHLPPLLITPDGPAEFLDLAVGPPVGVGARTARRSTEMTLQAGELLCFYTDGLIERRSEVLDAGMARLQAAVVPGRPMAVAARIMSELVGTDVLEDDVALLVLAVEAVDALDLQLAAEPQELSVVRSAVRRWLAETPATGEEADELLLAIGEATTNVVEHAYGPEGGVLDVRLELAGGDVLVRVADQGQWRSPRGSDRGRGTMLMRALCDDVEVDRQPGGTRIVLRKSLAEGAR
jgi:anti-sigma regulatory factor (Ser/Thr protein kinase)/putative methionine-R-sulfoxide reductase with GAF domain